MCFCLDINNCALTPPPSVFLDATEELILKPTKALKKVPQNVWISVLPPLASENI